MRHVQIESYSRRPRHRVRIELSFPDDDPTRLVKLVASDVVEAVRQMEPEAFELEIQSKYLQDSGLREVVMLVPDELIEFLSTLPGIEQVEVIMDIEKGVIDDQVQRDFSESG